MGRLATASGAAEDVTLMLFQTMEDLQGGVEGLRLPVSVNGRNMFAMVDTGAARTMITEALAKELKCVITPATGTHKMAGNLVAPRLATTTVTVVHMDVRRELQAEVMKEQPRGWDFTLGRKDVFDLGVRFQGGTMFPDQLLRRGQPAAGTGSNMYTPPAMSAETGQVEDGDGGASLNDDVRVEVPLPEQLRKVVEDFTASSMKKNADIPVTSYCSSDFAVLDVPTKDEGGVHQHQYPLPEVHEEIAQEEVRKWEATGVVKRVRPGTVWTSPVMVTTKRALDRSFSAYRVVLDLRAVNKKLQHEQLPIPRIPDLLKRLTGAAVFSALDLKSSYHQFRVREEDQHKLGFVFGGATYKYVRAPFGIASMTGFFQRAMEEMLSGCADFALVYVDDIVIYTKPLSPDESMESIAKRHAEQLAKVLEVLNANSLRLNHGKCKLAFEKLRIYGHVISRNKMFIDPEKVSTLASLPEPQSGRDVQSVLGVLNFHRSQIPNLAQLVEPLDRLRNVKKKKEFQKIWDSDPIYRERLQRAKTIMASAPVLEAVNPNHPLYVATDASCYGLGAVLFQEYDDERHYIAFASKALAKAQRNYPATKRELLGVVYALQKFRNYLLGRQFTLLTDHQALTHWQTTHEPSPVIFDWLDVLMEFNPTIVYCPGVENKLPDALSRLYPSYIDNAHAQPHAERLPLATPCDDEVTLMLMDVSEQDSAASAEEGEEKKSESKEAVDMEVTERVKYTERELKAYVEDRFNKTCPPADERADLVQRVHEEGHEGAEYLYRKIFDQGYWWPHMHAACARAVSGCKACLMFNVGKHGFHPMHHIKAKYPFDHIAIDTLDLSAVSSRGMSCVLLIVDIATRFVVLKAMTDKSAKSVARALWETMSNFGVPKVIQSDNGTEFVNKVVGEMTTLLGIDHRLTAVYHPQANGAAERMVRETKDLIKKKAEGNITDFDLMLPGVQMALNARAVSLTGSMPFSLMFARPLSPLTDYRTVDLELMSEAQLKRRCDTMLEVIYPQIFETSAARLAKRDAKANEKAKRGREETTYERQEWVMMKDPRRASKNEPKWVGPYEIIEVTEAKTLRLRDTTGEVMKNTVNPDAVQRVSARIFDPDDEIDIVEKILDDHEVNGKKEYLVKWKYKAAENNSWVPAHNFDDLECITVYEKNKSAKARAAAAAPAITSSSAAAAQQPSAAAAAAIVLSSSSSSSSAAAAARQQQPSRAAAARARPAPAAAGAAADSQAAAATSARRARASTARPQSAVMPTNIVDTPALSNIGASTRAGRNVAMPARILG